MNYCTCSCEIWIQYLNDYSLLCSINLFTYALHSARVRNKQQDSYVAGQLVLSLKLSLVLPKLVPIPICKRAVFVSILRHLPLSPLAP